MNDAELERQLAAARRADVAWTPSRAQQASWGASQRFEARRRSRKRLLAAAGLGTSVAAVVMLVMWGAPRPSTSARAPASLTSTLADGSTILLDDAATVVRKTVEREGEIRFQLESGGAGFDVAHRPSREFRVQAGPVSVQVIGTRFYVRRAGLQSRVAVDRGRVLVSWAGGSTTLGAGETGLFPPPPPDEAPAVKDPAPLPEPPTAPAHRSTAPDPKQRPDELFLQADRMRAASNPAGAVAALGELVRRFPTDPRAGAAAFTMGRLLLERLDRPQQAAAAFATARRLSTVRTLAEDALAREVEALAKAGDRDQARERAELYARLFPAGARRATVMRLAGLPSAH